MPRSTKAVVYARYRVRPSHRYKLDHLVSVGLGGSNAARNLWPQPYAGVWGARKKDRLERALRVLVCSGRLSLKSAQRQLAANWIEAYARNVLKPRGGRSVPVDASTSAAGPDGTKAAPPITPPDGTTNPPAANRIYWGAYIDGAQYGYANPPWDMRTIATFEAHAGKGISILHLGLAWQVNGTPNAFPGGALTTLRQHGTIPLVDWNSWDGGALIQPDFTLARIIDGSYDSYIASWAAAARAWGHPFFLRFDHEMNGRWFPWNEGQNGNTSGQYVQAWRHVHDLFDAAGVTNVSWVWCPNAEYPGSLPLEGLYPGSAYVDWTCIDAYNFGTNPIKPDVWRSFAQAVQPTYDHLETLAPAKPMMIGETASTEYGGSKPGWIGAALSSLPTLFPKIKALLWFDWPVGGEDWPLESSAGSLAAFADGIASPYFASNQFGAITESPIPPP